MKECERYVESVSLYADGELDGRARAALEAHLAVCPDCAARAKAFAAFRAVMPGLAEAPPPSLASGVMRARTQEDKRKVRPLRRGLVSLGVAAAVAAILFTLRGNVPIRPQSDHALAPANVMADNNAEETTQVYGQADLESAEAPGAPPPDAAEDAGGAMLPSLSMTESARTSNYAGTVSLSAGRIPEDLAGYPQTDKGDRVEITVTPAELQMLWPGLEAAGAVLDSAIADLLNGLAAENGETKRFESAHTEDQKEFLIIVYLTE